jgi:coronin-1B/1C/6
MRAYKTVNDSYIEPISFTVPRRAETFQSDIYPPAFGLKPAMSSKDWHSGKTAVPPKIDLESIYEGNAPVEIPADYKPPAAAAPVAAAKPTPQKEPEPVKAAVSRAPPPTATEQKASISAMANKYQDMEEEDEEDDDAETSSFEEISRPVQRSSVPAKAPAPIKATPAASQPKPQSPIKSPTLSRSTPTPTPPAAQGGSSVESSLEQIKQLLAQQNKIITAQTDQLNAQSAQLSQLASEVDLLKKRVGAGSQESSERLRQLELELEALRT